jgi:hypothetical protein
MKLHFVLDINVLALAGIRFNTYIYIRMPRRKKDFLVAVSNADALQQTSTPHGTLLAPWWGPAVLLTY